MSNYNCLVVPQSTVFDRRSLDIVPNGRAETIILDSDGVEYSRHEVFCPIEPLKTPINLPTIKEE